MAMPIREAELARLKCAEEQQTNAQDCSSVFVLGNALRGFSPRAQLSLQRGQVGV